MRIGLHGGDYMVTKKEMRRGDPKKNSSQGILSSQRVRLGILLLLIFILGSSLTLTIYTFYMVKDSNTTPYYFIVEDGVGIDAGTDSFAFGATRPSGTSTRHFFLSSETDVRVFLSATGEGSEWIVVSDNGFLLPAGEQKGIAITVIVPDDAPKKRYEGLVHMMFLRANAPFSPRENLLQVRD